MKPIFACILLLLYYYSHAQTKFSIEGNLTSLKKKAVIHLGWQEPGEIREFLKADVVNGKFSLKGSASQPTIGTMRVVTYNESSKPEQQFPWDCDVRSFFICEGNITIIGTDSIKTANINAPCKENGLLASFDSLINSTSKTSKAYETFIIQHKTSPLSVNLLNNYVYQARDKETFHFALVLLENLSPRLRASPLAIAIKNRIQQRLYPVAGTKLPAIELMNIEGKKAAISAHKGKLVLVDFWASWCVPCRNETPQLLALYEKYKDKGLEIASISIDNNLDAWKQAVKKDGLTWPQYIDKGPAWSGRATMLFRVSELPCHFLLDKDGVVIAEKLGVKELEAKIKSELQAIKQ